mmetsp:Transcript_57306/g.170890  ORF Transcript_57306/g.170890 Transcript_57306/m.170890 type:complete len:80 (+) Transcript_57306:3505-3744(+)
MSNSSQQRGQTSFYRHDKGGGETSSGVIIEDQNSRNKFPFRDSLRPGERMIFVRRGRLKRNLIFKNSKPFEIMGPPGPT